MLGDKTDLKSPRSQSRRSVLGAWARLVPLLLVFGLALSSCDSPPQSGDGSQLWIAFSEREVDLVLIDHEPPPF